MDRLRTVRFEPQGTTWDAFLHRLEALGFRAAIVGPEGAGKTTMLEDLRPRLERLGFRTTHLKLRRDEKPRPYPFVRTAATSAPDDLILFDGADHLGPMEWWRFRRAARRAGGLIITSHRVGLLPTLVKTTTSPRLLRHIVEKLLGEMTADLTHLSQRLFARHRGNLRNALRELYDLYAAKEE